MELPMNYFEHPGEMLLIGVGSGSLIKSYAEKGWRREEAKLPYLQRQSKLFQSLGRNFVRS